MVQHVISPKNQKEYCTKMKSSSLLRAVVTVQVYLEIKVDPVNHRILVMYQVHAVLVNLSIEPLWNIIYNGHILSGLLDVYYRKNNIEIHAFKLQKHCAGGVQHTASESVPVENFIAHGTVSKRCEEKIHVLN